MLSRAGGSELDGADRGDANLYSYVLQDPVNLVDPSGLVLDVVADVGFIAYDVYEIVDYFASDCVADDVIETGEKVPRAFNPFYGKNPEQIDEMLRAKGFEQNGACRADKSS